MLSLTLSGVAEPGLLGGCWGECRLASRRPALASVSEGEMGSSMSHCRRTSRAWGREQRLSTVSSPEPRPEGDGLPVATYGNFSGGVVSAEAVEDDVGGDAHHAE